MPLIFVWLAADYLVGVALGGAPQNWVRSLWRPIRRLDRDGKGL